jgi:hypothetical protein
MGVNLKVQDSPKVGGQPRGYGESGSYAALIPMGTDDGQFSRIIFFARRSTGPDDALSSGHA